MIYEAEAVVNAGNYQRGKRYRIDWDDVRAKALVANGYLKLTGVVTDELGNMDRPGRPSRVLGMGVDRRAEGEVDDVKDRAQSGSGDNSGLERSGAADPQSGTGDRSGRKGNGSKGKPSVGVGGTESRADAEGVDRQ